MPIVDSIPLPFTKEEKVRIYLRSLLLVSMLVACSESKSPPTEELTFSLTAVQSCEELSAHLKQVALQEMRQSIKDLREGRYGYGIAANERGLASATAEAADSSAGAAEAPAHSETNTQEEGVDEADIVKTDGNYVYVLAGGYLSIFRSFPAAELTHVTDLPVPGYPLEMFLQGDRVVTFSRLWGEELPAELRPAPAGTQGDRAACGAPGCWSGREVTQISVIDVSNRTQPRILREIASEANYVSSRRIAASVHVVLNGAAAGPELLYQPENLEFDWYDPKRLNPLQRARFDQALRAMENENRQRIESAPLEAYVPRTLNVDRIAGTRELGMIAPCEQFYRSSQPDGRQVLDIMTLRLDDAGAPAHAAIAGYGAEVYASTSSLYVASHPFSSAWMWWGWREGRGQDEKTRIHKFDIASDPARAQYRMSGAVEGHLPRSNAQFAMDEEQDHLRIATTTELPDGVSLPEGNIPPTANQLAILHENPATRSLEVVGRVAGLAPGERIFSARFVGNRGYIVTFRNVDPLFAFDLSVPSAPQLKGELKIPGFSTYMHPIDETHLLTIGRDADPVSGQVGPMQLSLFDVSDLSQPRLMFTPQVVTGVNGFSEAMFNHKAFSYFAPQQLVAIPVTDYSNSAGGYCWQPGYVGLKVFRVTLESGFQPVADIRHNGYYTGGSQNYCGLSGWNEIRRSLTIEDHLYSISGRAVVASPLANLSGPPTASALLPTPRNYSGGWIW